MFIVVHYLCHLRHDLFRFEVSPFFHDSFTHTTTGRGMSGGSFFQKPKLLASSRNIEKCSYSDYPPNVPFLQYITVIYQTISPVTVDESPSLAIQWTHLKNFCIYPQWVFHTTSRRAMAQLDTWSADVIRAIERHDLDALRPLIHSEISDRNRIERLPTLYYKAFGERTASPELYEQIYDAVKENPVARERLRNYVSEFSKFEYTGTSECLWYKALERHYFDLAQVMFETYSNEIVGSDEVYIALHFLVFLCRNGNEVDLKLLDYLSTLPIVLEHDEDIISFTVDFLYERLDMKGLELDETTGHITRGGVRVRSSFKRVVDWLVAAGWTPHDEGSEEEMNFRARYNQTPLQSLMSFIDDKVQSYLPDGVYIELATHMKRLHDMR